MITFILKCFFLQLLNVKLSKEELNGRFDKANTVKDGASKQVRKS